jgi:hypothetical protein
VFPVDVRFADTTLLDFAAHAVTIGDAQLAGYRSEP